jgi:hypothetical protein
VLGGGGVRGAGAVLVRFVWAALCWRPGRCWSVGGGVVLVVVLVLRLVLLVSLAGWGWRWFLLCCCAGAG